MGAKADATKDRILEVAQNLILQKGFSGTSIDEIIQSADITKGGFFYHFKGGRSELAKELMLRFLRDDEVLLDGLIKRAGDLTDDPLQRLLIFLKLYSEVVENLPVVHPGCLIASYTYESHQFSPEIVQMTRDGVETWRKQFLSLFDGLFDKYESATASSPEDLTDMLNSLIEGAIVLAKLSGSNEILKRQMLNFREYVKLMFKPRPNLTRQRQASKGSPRDATNYEERRMSAR